MLNDFFHDYVMLLVDPFLFMQLRGVLVDREEQKTLLAEFTHLRNEAAGRLEVFSGGRKIIAKKTISNKVLAQLLYEDLKLPEQRNSRTGKITTNKEALIKLAAKVTDDKQAAFSDILAVRELVVLMSTFLEINLDNDGRLRTSYNIAGTETGRLSSSTSPWWSGAQMQNWPAQGTEDTPVAIQGCHERVRDIVIADPGKVFIYADGEQAEARVVAWLAGDKHLMEIFDSGQDVHKLMASRIFNKPIEEIGDDSPERYLAKRTIHGAHYGMGKRKFATYSKLPERAAEILLLRYFAEFPTIKSRFQAGIKMQVEKTRTLTTPFGRRRQFFGRMSEDLVREAYATIPQSTIADWLDVGLLRLWRFKQGQFNCPSSSMSKYLSIENTKYVTNRENLQLDIEPAIQIHDGLLTQIPISQLRQAIPAIRECLTYPIIFPNGPLTIPVDIKVGFRWGKKSLKKPTEEWLVECEKRVA